MAPVDHRCEAGRHCLARTADGPAITARPMCDSCVNGVQECYNQLRGYRDMLELFKGYKQSAAGGARVSASKGEPPTPLNVTVVDLIDDITSILIRSQAYLMRDLITLPGGVDLAMDVWRAHAKAEGICGLQKVWERRHAPCPECGLSTLGGWLGGDEIICTNSQCYTSLSKEQYEEYCDLKSKAKTRGKKIG